MAIGFELVPDRLVGLRDLALGAVDEMQEAGRPFISVLVHPTTGGVAASFAALGDVIIAEPGALLSFSGPRVVKQTLPAALEWLWRDYPKS